MMKDQQYLTAVHEAGHACVLKRFGVATKSAIWQIDGAWTGVCYSTNTEHCPPNWKVLLGLAGMLAELIIIRASHFPPPEAAFAWLRMKTFSRTDRELAGDFTVDDVAEAMDLLCEQWNAVLDTAEDLMNVSSQNGNRPPRMPN
jgi:hypothetical protein